MDGAQNPSSRSESLEVGTRATFRRLMRAEDAARYFGHLGVLTLTHDQAPYQPSEQLQARLGAGMLVANLLAHVASFWSIAVTQVQLDFAGPIMTGDEITVEFEVVETDPSSGWVMLRCECWRGRGGLLLSGEISGISARY